ncbi:Ketosamine-3-kinase [Dothidotthia symphoricarpi CBS 119687]|uniref:protein-ribulosamine 3-kinase n=1 Tax=Dothidotthia symphoricarpi CBS 119687 TaxID=1392245 RepID=A0A6A6AL26_9PLEO|nr:Ketosamine-3-kinase [Dothidotthia symphoricarpi CBS 119687]KAF2131838.1 Ketosamine-3-kinase [Dothidotthia symphoricarpi CBS 119687]
MELDPAVATLLNLEGENATVSSAGGGGCSSASTFKITCKSRDTNSEKAFFMKTGQGKAAETMFEGEHASLTALHNTVPSLCPKSYGHGRFENNPQTSFLVTQFLHRGSHSPSSKAPSLAAKLAKLHTTPAPIPDGHDKPMFGFPVPTCCGDTPQDNTYKSTWAAFFSENRLRFILQRAEAAHGTDAELHDLVEKTASTVVPRLLSDNHVNNGHGITPVVVHGDLWSGNASVGVLGEASNEAEDVVFDASACYAHGEFELGIMGMFGGFGGAFWEEYHALSGRMEPRGEYGDRVRLYEVYHQLNHYAMFGGGYRGGAVGIMRALVGRYAV